MRTIMFFKYLIHIPMIPHQKAICLTLLITQILSLPCSLISQNFDRINIPVIKGQKNLKYAGAGGIKAGQFSNIDLNNDGVKDLFVFDRNGDQILPFIKTGAVGSLDFEFAPEYISVFPKLTNWALLYDYNRDGVEDIFTSSNKYPACIEVWKGKRDAGGRLTFKMLTFNYGLPEIIQFPITGGYTQIYVSNIDIPAITDIDGDGDTDIVSFEPDGSYASYYKNLSVEENLGPDSLKFIRQDICWGKFAENQFNEAITLSSDPFGCAAGFTSGGNTGVRHSGSTLTIFDNNGDGLMDLILGDLASSKLKRLINGGAKDLALITSVENNFPVDDIPVYLDVFLASYYADTDGDNIRDLIVTPNDINSGESDQHVLLYKNHGTDIHPVFKLRKKDFLIDEMAFFNSGSHPAFADINGDGLQDILIGTNGILKKSGVKENRMVLLLNTGTKSEPEFTYSDEDYLYFSKFGDFTGRFAPCFGDLDDDGDLDLLVGDSFGQLYYLPNIAGKDKPMQFGSPVYPYNNISIGQNAKPQIIDLDNDGLKDIVIGKKNNQLNFFKNTGTKGSPKFDSNPDQLPNTSQLGKIFSFNDFNTQNGAPYFIKEKNKFLMLLGTEAADIITYNMLENNIYSQFNLLYNKTGGISQGRKSTVSLADIDDDGYYEIVVGNERGGIAFYNTIFKSDNIINTVTPDTGDTYFTVFPNPAHDELFIMSTDNNVQCRLLDLYGNVITSLLPNTSNKLNGIQEGIYILQLQAANKTYFKKIVIQAQR